jgi:hypothetical protein
MCLLCCSNLSRSSRERVDEVAKSHNNGSQQVMKSHRDRDVAAMVADERTVA